MLKTAIIVCAISLAATGSLYAAETIEVEKLSKADLLTALQTASDDTVIEFQGTSKTKAQWRSEFQATQKRALEKQKGADAAAKARFDAAAKASTSDPGKVVVLPARRHSPAELEQARHPRR